MIVGLRERLNMRLHLQAIQRKQCASTATQRGIGSVAAQISKGPQRRKSRKGINESKRLKHGELNLVIGNKKIMPVIRIGKYKLMLKSGVRIDLNNSSPCEGIYETIECISHNGNVILNVGSSNELDKSKLWHSRLGHVNKKHIVQLQKDGVLESFDFKSDDVCESCLLGKMTKSLFKGSCERDEGLLDFGCEVFVRREAQDKLEARSKKYLFVGYPEESFGYLFYKPKYNVVIVAQRRVFLEREKISKEDSGSKIDLEEIPKSTDEEPIVNTDTQLEVDKISDSTLSELDEPANYKEAMASLEAAKWKEAMKSEIQSMYDNQVWNLVDTTSSLKMVGCKWIFKKKTNMDGKVHTYKARLAAKGYTETHEIDYEETFSLVAKIKSIRIMLAIAAFHDYEIWQRMCLWHNQKVLKMQSILKEFASFKMLFMDLNRLLVARISLS
ncbi:retrotransposon protein, putative, ty1-copia subclass [Tanacetum coccineum]